MSRCTPEPSIFAGLDRTYLQAQLTALQKALISLQAGAQVVTAQYAQGDGNKSVTFRQADMGSVTATIRMLQKELGVVRHARRRFRPLYL